jgi:hypothetical protein
VNTDSALAASRDTQGATEDSRTRTTPQADADGQSARSRPIGARPQRQLAERGNWWAVGEKSNPGQLALALNANWPRARCIDYGRVRRG